MSPVRKWPGKKVKRPKLNYKEVYPCNKEDCVNYYYYNIGRPESLYPVVNPVMTLGFPNIMFACLFCTHFKREDMYFKKGDS
jgi:hypothetical protein